MKVARKETADPESRGPSRAYDCLGWTVEWRKEKDREGDRKDGADKRMKEARAVGMVNSELHG